METNAISGLFKAYWRYYHKLKDAYVILAQNEEGSISISGSNNPETGQGVMRAENNIAHNPLIEQFLALMAYRFLNPLDSLYYKKIWDTLKTNFAVEIGSETIEQADKFISELNGNSNINLNNRTLSLEDIVKAIGQGDFFGQPGEARDLFTELTDGPFGSAASTMAWQQYYQFNINAFILANHLFSLFVNIKNSGKHNDLFIANIVSENDFCIFCLTDSNSFNSEEHIIPEALGNYDVTLPPGYVCDKCNGILSEVDKVLKEYTPIAFVSLLHVPYTKKGKYPTAKFEGVEIKRVRPNQILIKEQAKNPNKRAITNLREFDDGLVTFNFSVKGKSPDWKKLGRALYKIALEVVAFQQSREQACHGRYDAARKFVLNGETFDNNLFLIKKGEKSLKTQIAYKAYNVGTFFQIHLLGLSFFLNLEETPKIDSQNISSQFEIDETILNDFSLVISLKDGIVISVQS